jgi:hypothetical protein
LRGRAPFSRSYGVKLPSSLRTVLSSAVRILSSPTCVSFGTGPHLTPDGFSRSDVCVLRQQIGLALSGTLYSHSGPRSCPTSPPAIHTKCRNINLLAISYAFRPRLRIRLTLGGIPFPRKPWAYGEQDFHLLYRYSSRHVHLLALHEPFPDRFTAPATLSYHSYESIASALRLFPIIIGARILVQ